MVTKYEVQKLIHDMRDELQATPGAAFRYIVGALVFFGFALAGLLTDQPRDATRDAAAAATPAAMRNQERAPDTRLEESLKARCAPPPGDRVVDEGQQCI